MLIRRKSTKKANTTGADNTLANSVNLFDGSGGYTQQTLTRSQMEGGRIYYMPILIVNALGWE